MLYISLPAACPNEQDYITGILFRDFLGIEFQITQHDKPCIEITQPSSSAKLSINNDFFNQADKHWLKEASMPSVPLKCWSPEQDGIHAKLVEKSVPVLFGQPGIEKNSDHWHVNLDVFGSAFFMLSRYEELIVQERDEHDRFPAKACTAYKEGFLDRPIINEYLEILWSCLQQLFSNLRRKKRTFRKLISCDVDQPFDPSGHSLKRIILRMGLRIVREKNIKIAVKEGLNYVLQRINVTHFDEYYSNFDWMMKVNQKAGNKVAFYFIPIQTDSNKEEANDIRHSKLLELLKRIHNQGHEVGFHPGYNTYRFKEHFNQSALALRTACESTGISSVQMGGRQHYLRFDIGKTPLLWERNGFKYDATLGYADRAGFRCGICYEYTMYELTHRRTLQLKQRPLIVMEGTVIEAKYEGLGDSDKGLKRMRYFKKTCEQFQGDFTLLWHNSNFTTKKLRANYLNLIQ